MSTICSLATICAIFYYIKGNHKIFIDNSIYHNIYSNMIFRSAVIIDKNGKCIYNYIYIVLLTQIKSMTMLTSNNRRI